MDESIGGSVYEHIKYIKPLILYKAFLFFIKVLQLDWGVLARGTVSFITGFRP